MNIEKSAILFSLYTQLLGWYGLAAVHVFLLLKVIRTEEYKEDIFTLVLYSFAMLVSLLMGYHVSWKLYYFKENNR